MAGVTLPLTTDVGFTLAQALLRHMLDRMTANGCEPGKSFVADGATVPAEDCCDGVAWTRVGDVEPTDGSGDTYAEMRNAPQGPSGHMITIEAGVLRCAPVLGELGEAPPADDYTNSAQLVAADRLSLRQAILCDWPADIIANQADGFIPSNWTPIEAGGCGGGFMTVRVGTTLVF